MRASARARACSRAGWARRRSRLDDIGVTVGAIVAVNSAGNVADPATGLPWMADQIAEFGLSAAARRRRSRPSRARDAELSPLNTTIAVVATDALLSKAACKRVADRRAGRAWPAPSGPHTRRSTATPSSRWPRVPSRSTAERPDTPAAMSPETKLTTAVGAAAADCLARAVMVGVLAAESVAGIPTYRDMLPGAFAKAAGVGRAVRSLMLVIRS